MSCVHNPLLLTDVTSLTKCSLFRGNASLEGVVHYVLKVGDGKFDRVVFFGLQIWLKKYFCGQVVTRQFIDEADEFYRGLNGDHSIFNKFQWEYVLEKYNGRLPIEITAVSEGTVCEQHSILITVKNTDPKCWWLPGYFKQLLSQLWYPTIVATNSRAFSEIIAAAISETSDDVTKSGLPFKLHDFGFRGVSSVETASVAGAAHLVNFMGSDTIAGIHLMNNIYNAGMAGFSIPAAEHSTITAWRRDGELDAYRNMLEKFPGGLVAVVSDSYDIFSAIEKLWGEELKEGVIRRGDTTGSVVVIRSDSGDVGPTVTKCLNLLGEKFGYETNAKGYKILPKYIRLIHGDGISLDSLPDILKDIVEAKWAAENVTFGSGGALLQRVDRSTQHFSFERSIGDDSIPKAHSTIFRNGELLVDHILEDVRKRAAIVFDDIAAKRVYKS